MLSSKIRYSKIMERNRDLFDVGKSVLELGAGNPGIAPHLRRTVFGVAPKFQGPVSEWLKPVTGNVLDIPYPSASFDIVLCVDIFGRLSPSSRKRALEELIRVAKEKVILSCPCDLFAAEGEHSLAELFRETPLGVPDWLTAHLDPGLPDVGDIIELILATGLSFEIVGNEGLMQHYGAILLDFFFPFAAKAHKLHAYKALIDPPIARGAWDLFYSYVFTLNKTFVQPPYAGPSARMARECSDARQKPGHGARVYCVFHKPADTSHLGKVEPIFAGAAASSAPPSALTDVPVREPRLLNSRWSELSAIYKVWRDGPRSEVLGFCHYRRLFNFTGSSSKGRDTRIYSKRLAEFSEAYFDEAVIASAREDVVITPPPLVVDAASIWHHYCIWHDPGDWCHILSRVSHQYPSLLPYAVAQFRSRSLYANNLFIMNWDLFDELCSVWFDLLGDFEREVPSRHSTAYQNRDLSFLAERIFDLWLRSKQQAGTRVVHVPIFFVEYDGK